jgi:hypothetical protein
MDRREVPIDLTDAPWFNAMYHQGSIKINCWPELLHAMLGQCLDYSFVNFVVQISQHIHFH